MTCLTFQVAVGYSQTIHRTFSPAEHCARAIGSDDYLFELFPFSDSSIGGKFQYYKMVSIPKDVEQGTEVNYFN